MFPSKRWSCYLCHVRIVSNPLDHPWNMLFRTIHLADALVTREGNRTERACSVVSYDPVPAVRMDIEPENGEHVWKRHFRGALRFPVMKLNWIRSSFSSVIITFRSIVSFLHPESWWKVNNIAERTGSRGRGHSITGNRTAPAARHVVTKSGAWIPCLLTEPFGEQRLRKKSRTESEWLTD